MTGLALFCLACALFASVSFTFASTVPVVNGELVNIEKRITHTGAVISFFPLFPSRHILIIHTLQ